MINYKDTFTNSVTSDFLNYNALTNPSITNNLFKSLHFKYAIKIVDEDLNRQAKIFARYVITHTNWYVGISGRAWNDDQDKENLENLYKYSYFKMIYMMSQSMNGTSIFSDNISYMFYGHHYCLKAFSARYVVTEKDNVKLRISRRILLSREDYAILKDNYYMLRRIEEDEGHIPQFEAYFRELRKKDPNIRIDNINVTFNFNENSCPLGSGCYSYKNGKETINIVRDIKTNSDYDSIYFNTANFITLKDESMIDEDDSIYLDIPLDRVTKERPKLEVKAITGIDNTSKSYSEWSTSTPSSPGNTGIDPKGGKDKPTKDNSGKDKADSNKPNPNTPKPKNTSNMGKRITNVALDFITNEQSMNNLLSAINKLAKQDKSDYLIESDKIKVIDRDTGNVKKQLKDDIKLQLKSINKSITDLRQEGQKLSTKLTKEMDVINNKISNNLALTSVQFNLIKALSNKKSAQVIVTSNQNGIISSPLISIN
jgi:gas vesicle protein